MQPPPVKISWDAEMEMELKKKRDAKRSGGAPSAGSVEIPSPSSSAGRNGAKLAAAEVAAPAAKPVPTAGQPVTVAKPATSSAVHDLLGLGKSIEDF